VLLSSGVARTSYQGTLANNEDTKEAPAVLTHVSTHTALWMHSAVHTHVSSSVKTGLH
jgi:hypothetical protein